LLLRICITCDRYVDRPPTSGERLADAVCRRLEARPDLDLSVLRVACLNGCKRSCQALLTGREPVRVEGLLPDDAGFLVDLASVYCCGGQVVAMLANRLRDRFRDIQVRDFET
jgi:predicted metal-binding protein